MSNILEIKALPIATPYGTVSVTVATTKDADSTNPDDTALLLLHGNSSCSRVFKHIISRPPPGIGRVVAMDYLGHGQSEDATREVELAYTQPGYAETATAVLAALDVRQAVVLGWSLGGHVAIEMVPRLAASAGATTTKLRGIMIVGTPPVGNAQQVRVGFDPSTGEASAERESRKGDEGRGDGSDVKLPDFPAAREVWSEEECMTYPFLSHGQPHEDWMVEAAKRTDGRSRAIMFRAMAQGTGCDQVGVVESSEIPFAVLNGANEQDVNMDYIDGIKFKNLWEGKCYRIPDAGHTSLWEKPDEFQKYLWRFIKDCTTTK